jgi:hypothetical protein
VSRLDMVARFRYTVMYCALPYIDRSDTHRLCNYFHRDAFSQLKLLAEWVVSTFLRRSNVNPLIFELRLLCRLCSSLFYS